MTFVVLLGACGGTPPRPPQGMLPSAAKPAAWQRHELELVGVSAEFPGRPGQMERFERTNEVEIHVEGLSFERDEQKWNCFRAWVPGRDRREDEAYLDHLVANFMQQVSRQSSTQLGGFRGVAVEGKSKAGNDLLARIYAVADGALYATVEAPPKKLDRPKAIRFLDSCQFRMPWRLYASLEGEFTVFVPAVAIELDAAKTEMGPDTVGRIFVVGGSHELTYMVASVAIDAELRASSSDEELLDRVVEVMLSEDARDKEIGALEMDGAAGRELAWRTGELHQRWRVLVTETHMYQLAVYSKSKPDTTNREAERFLSSFRRGR